MASCRTGSVFGAAALLGTGVIVGGMLDEAVSPAHAATAQPEEGMSQEEMMAQWIALGTPGEHHRKLDYAVGDWDVDAKFMMPGEDGVTTVGSGGTMETEWVLGGRFVQTRYHLDDMMGQPFDGIAYVGYDNAAGEYVSIWMDSMSTKAHVHRGWFEGDTFITQGESGMGGEMRIVSKQVDDRTVVDEFYERATPDAEWTMNGSSTYTRK
ncbi:MAG: DUF1579 family protein [Planctomycetota bacterium]